MAEILQIMDNKTKLLMDRQVIKTSSFFLFLIMFLFIYLFIYLFVNLKNEIILWNLFNFWIWFISAKL